MRIKEAVVINYGKTLNNLIIKIFTSEQSKVLLYFNENCISSSTTRGILVVAYETQKTCIRYLLRVQRFSKGNKITGSRQVLDIKGNTALFN